MQHAISSTLVPVFTSLKTPANTQTDRPTSIIATSSSPGPISPPINPIHFIFGGIGGAVEAPARSVLDTAKSKAQLSNLNTIAAIKQIYGEKGVSGFFPYIGNTTAIRCVQRGGLFTLANSDMPIPVKTAIGFVYELGVTSVNQVITTHAAGNNKELNGNPFRFVLNQFKTHGIKGIVSPWTAARNVTFLGIYNVSMSRYQDERKSNPLLTNLGIGVASTAISHIFDPSSTHHTRYPSVPTFDVPKTLFKNAGLKGLLGNGMPSRLGSVGVGMVLYGTVADTIKGAFN